MDVFCCQECSVRNLQDDDEEDPATSKRSVRKQKKHKAPGQEHVQLFILEHFEGDSNVHVVRWSYGM